MRKLILLALLLTGCTTTKLTYENVTFVRHSFATKVQVGSVTASKDKDGSVRFELQNYSNDAAQAVGVAVESAVKAAINSAK